MKIEYNVSGAEKKKLIKSIEDILGSKSRYLGTPTFAYQIGYITVGRNGEVSWEEDESFKVDADKLRRELKEQGFKEAEADAEETAVISIPIEEVDPEKLAKLLVMKQDLIKKALDVDSLSVIFEKDKAVFPWFERPLEDDEKKAYTDFISALCRMSKRQTRINSTEKTVENEKYAFRCFLLRLGFIGDEYKEDRKILLKNLSGSSSFKNKPAKKEIAV